MRLFYSIYLTQKINKNHKISRSIDFSKHHTKPLEAWNGWKEIILELEGKSMPSKAILSIMKVLVKYLRIIKTVICTSILAFLVLLVLFQVSLEFIEGFINTSNCRQVHFFVQVTICYVCLTLCVINHFQKSMPNSTSAICKKCFIYDRSKR